MSGNNSLIQIQWSLDNTVFKTVELLQSLIKVAAEDDVHAQVVLAFEALGSALLVSPKRIGEGVDALSRSQLHKLSIGRKLRAIVGLNGLGIAQIIRKSPAQCVPAFLLVTSLKICFNDMEIGNILHEMLLQFGLMRTFPASSIQMSQLATSISGYGDSIIPTKTLEIVTDALCQAARFSPRTKIFLQADTKSVAEILARTFGALLKDDIKRVTLQGEVGGAFLASIFLWLLPDEFGLCLEGVPVLGEPAGRVILDLEREELNRWVIREWQAQEALSEVIVAPEELYEILPVRFTGASSGLHVISTQFQLDDNHIGIVGQLATALIQISYEHGILSSDVEAFPGTKRTVRLSDLCHTSFAGNIANCMTVFGWKCDEQFNDCVRKLWKAMDEWIALGCPSTVEPTHYPQISRSPGLYLYWVFDNLDAWMKTRPDYIGFHLDYREEVLDPAVFLAAEALYACICDVLPSYRSLRGCNPSTLSTNFATLVALVFVPRPIKDPSKSPPKDVNSGLNMMSVSEFRRLAMTSLIPGSLGNVERRDLVFRFNGYVAFASPLRRMSTVPRECVAISIVPGVIRWGEDNATFDKICEMATKMSPNAPSGKKLVEVFNRESKKYLGLEPKIDESGLEIENLISASGKTLLLRTYLYTPQTQNRVSVEVDWLSSINAVATSIQVDEKEMLPTAEEALANQWLKEHEWDRMTWVQAHGSQGGAEA
ncbi:hypothetical protein DL769_008751 [Monosporascus sp. CRB-8-3]|nr:hypothetical protein DL769_008751 [Monosporascus sp. CRB-8-3]